jgi:magnesium transporter
MASAKHKRRRLSHLARREEPPGSPPGVLAPPLDAEPTTLSVIHYTAAGTTEHPRADWATVEAALAAPDGVTWVHVVGLADVPLIERLAGQVGLDRLLLADIVSAQHRPKSDLVGSVITLLLRLPPRAPNQPFDQFGLIIGRRFVITVDERAGDCFEPLRERIRAGGRVCTLGADHLAYRIVDAVVDAFFPLLEAEGETLEEIEEGLRNPKAALPLQALHATKRRLLGYRRAIWPLREIVSALSRDRPDLIGAEARRFLRDTYDHVVELIDLVEIYRDTASSLAELSLAMVNTRMNDVMKLLAVISTIFMPLTFIAGVYGMNFDPTASPWNMPELGWRWGYPAAMLLMLLIAVGLVIYFRQRGFIGRHGTTLDEP